MVLINQLQHLLLQDLTVDTDDRDALEGWLRDHEWNVPKAFRAYMISEGQPDPGLVADPGAEKLCPGIETIDYTDDEFGEFKVGFDLYALIFC